MRAMNYLLWISLGVFILGARCLRYCWCRGRLAFLRWRLASASESAGKRMASEGLGDPYLLTLISVAPQHSAERSLLVQLLGLTLLANTVAPLGLHTEHAQGRPIYLAYHATEKNCTQLAYSLWPQHPIEKIALACNIFLIALTIIILVQ